MRKTAGVPVSRPRWPCYPDCSCTTLVSSAHAARLSIGFRAEGVRQVKKLYIGNLPFSATEDQLQEWFSQVGVSPSGVNLIRDRFTGQSRGFAFVEINSDEDADRAINSLNGQNFGGRKLVVNEAGPQAEPRGVTRGAVTDVLGGAELRVATARGQPDTGETNRPVTCLVQPVRNMLHPHCPGVYE